MRDKLELEFSGFETFTSRLELQKNLNEKEIANLEKEQGSYKEQLSKLGLKTLELQARLSQAQTERTHREEYSRIVDDWSKPRLTLSRDSATRMNEQLEEEIEELQARKNEYIRSLGQQKEQFQDIINSIEVFKKKVTEEREESPDDDDLEDDNNNTGMSKKAFVLNCSTKIITIRIY